MPVLQVPMLLRNGGKTGLDDGMSIYEIEFKAGGYEYSYEVDAATGSIVEFDKEWMIK